MKKPSILYHNIFPNMEKYYEYYKMKNNINFWDLFNDIVCISLITEEERFSHAQNQFKENNINNIRFYRPERDPKGGMRGCFQSHVHVIKEAYERGSEKLLVFEDDIKINKFNHKLWTLNLQSFFELYDFNILNLCYSLDYKRTINNFKKISETDIKNIFEFRSALTHAYIISRKCMKMIKDLEYDKVQMQIDAYYMKNIDNNYSINPPLVIQDSRFGSSTLYTLKDIIPKFRDSASKTSFFIGLNIFSIIIIVILIISLQYVSKCQFCENRFGGTVENKGFICKK